MVAICDVLVPKAAVGAVGVPVKEGDAMVARNDISAVFNMMFDVFELTLASNAASAFVALVISVVILVVFEVILVLNKFSAFVALVVSAVILAVLAAIEFVLLVILKVLAAIAFVLLVMLAVFEAIAFVLLVILDVLAVIAFVLLVILEIFEAIAFVLLVILEVLEAINVGSVAMVAELTPPTELTVVVKVPNPPPLTSPINSTY